MKAHLFAALSFVYIFSVSVVVLGGAYLIISACVTDKYSNASLIYQYYEYQEGRESINKTLIINTIGYPAFNSILSKI